MVPKGSLIVVAFAVILLLLPSAAAQDETRVATTELNIKANQFHSVGNTLTLEEPTQGFLDFEFCHEAGGFNPQGAQFILTPTFEDVPSWLTVEISGDAEASFPLPFGPATAADCPANTTGDWELVATASRSAPYSEKIEFRAVVTVEEDGSSHTYQIPDSKSAVFTIETEPNPEDDITKKLDNASRNPGPSTPTPNGNNEPEESPPAPVAAILIGVVLLVALTRRR